MNKEKTKVTNRQAFRDYVVDKKYEAGIQLQGNEIKSIRDGKASLAGCFAKIEKGELYLYNMHINPYKFSRDEYNPLRPRKLLLHKREIEQLITKTSQDGYTIVPLKIFFSRKYAKVEIALCKGKKRYDKREDIKKEAARREMKKALSKNM